MISVWDIDCSGPVVDAMGQDVGEEIETLRDNLLEKHELEIVYRSLCRSIAMMRRSEFVSENDPHLLKIKATAAKVDALKESL